MKKEHIKKGILLLGSLIMLMGCETGVSNKKHQANAFQEGTASTSSSATAHKPAGTSASHIKKIFSKSGTPGYYIQVGYFKSEKPSSDFVNLMKQEQLPYKLLKKFENGEPRYHALIGPYRSYNEANRMKNGTAKHLTHNSFIVQLARP